MIGSAEVAPERLGPAVRGSSLLEFQKVVGRVQLRILQEVEAAAVELVRAALRDGVDDDARRAAVLRAVFMRQDLELCHRIDGHARLRERAGAVVLVVLAVDQIQVAAALASVRVRTPILRTIPAAGRASDRARAASAQTVRVPASAGSRCLAAMSAPICACVASMSAFRR